MARDNFLRGGSYMAPWSKIGAKDGIVIPYDMYRTLGRMLVEEIVKEIKKEIQRTKAMSSDGVSRLPESREFVESFYFDVQGNRVTIGSTWPWTPMYVDGVDPYRMVWLTQSNGVGIVPIKSHDGTILFRMAPSTPDRAWVHPGIERNNFLQRGTEKAKGKFREVVAQYVLDQFVKGDPTR